MAQQKSTTKAVAQAGTDRTEFLSGLNADDYESTSPAIGTANTDTSVCVFNKEKPQSTPVMLVLRGSGFALHNMLSIDEARTLACALNMGADYAETQALDQFIDKALAAAGVAA
jgi:hypothetical protein